MPGAFKHQDEMRVPLVWQHGHSDPENVLGHVILENRDDGVYAHGFFNDSDRANHTRGLLEHGDINMLSIWANELVERAGRVLHGAIREVSLVLSGANPGAVIENITIRHSDGEETELDDEVIIYTGIEIDDINVEHDDNDDNNNDENEDENENEDELQLSHADDDETVEDIYNSMNEKQKNVLHFMIGEALASTEKGSAEQSNLDHQSNDDQEGNKMSRNVFEKDETDSTPVLSHSAVQEIVADATKKGSLKEAVQDYALAHGINDIELLFPEATAMTASPEFITRRMEWVNGVLSGARKTPFSRIKTHTADLTFEDARAKGYIKGTMKKEQFFGTSRRVTTPQTIYKKQKLDRDDIIDITDFDVVTWMKGEMRIMLDEELARAVLIGDGRDPGDEDKINETNIRSIANDDDFYTITVTVNIGDASSSVTEIVDAIVLNRQYLRGSGQPTMYTTETVIAKFLLLKDTLGRRIYTSLDQLASELRVSSIVPVEVLGDEPDILAILVNMTDYVIGADKGGQVALFDDFDIDYNQYKYLIETRCSGALIRPKAAMVVRSTASANVLVTPTAPTFNEGTGVVTIPTQTGVEYRNADTDAVLTAGAQSALAEGATLNVVAVPDGDYYFGTSENDTWGFTRPTS